MRESFEGTAWGGGTVSRIVEKNVFLPDKESGGLMFRNSCEGKECVGAIKLFIMITKRKES